MEASDGQTSDGQTSDDCSAFYVRRKTAWSRELGAGTGKRCRLRRHFKNAADGSYEFALFGRKASGGRFSAAVRPGDGSSM